MGGWGEDSDKPISISLTNLHSYRSKGFFSLAGEIHKKLERV